MEPREILIVREPISLREAQELADRWHKHMVKGVADCRRGIIALGGTWHMEANVCLLQDGSSPEDTWGFSLYPHEEGEQALDYISAINVRPGQDNYEMELTNPQLRDIIKELVRASVPELNL